MAVDYKINIPYDVVEDFINCSICLSVIRGSVLTPCGHRYCNSCITEWVGRNHTCPCCNSTLNTGQFYCDVQFDSLVDAVLTHRDKSEQEYFDKMFTQLGPGEDVSKEDTMFEGILKKHLKSSLFSHQRYFAKLREEYQKKVQRLSIGIGSENLSHDETSLINQSPNEMMDTLKKNLEDSENLAATAFDKYLTENLPTLEVMPVTVSVYIADKDVRIQDVVINPSDKLCVLRAKVEAAMAQRSDDVISWLEGGGTCLLVGPLSKSDQYNIDNVKKLVSQMHDIHILSWDTRPVLQFSMRPNSEIILLNTLRSESDLPKKCFVNVYNKSDSQLCDYFHCQNCNIKWVCRSCMQCCHTGHNVSPFVMQHKPTWACCYCPKKKLCKIQGVT